MVRMGKFIGKLSAACLLAAFLGTATPAAAQPYGVERERAVILQALATDDSPQTRQLMERVRDSRELRQFFLAEVFQTFADAGHYPQVYGLIETIAVPRLIGADDYERRAWLDLISKVQHGPAQPGETPRWRTVPEVAAHWPQLALRINRHLKAIDGLGGIFADALVQLSGKDFRENPEVTLFLAAANHGPVIAWAIDEMKITPLPLPPQGDPNRRAVLEQRLADHDRTRLPLGVLIGASSDESGEALEMVYCQSLDRRDSLLLAFGDHGTGEDLHLVERFADPAQVKGASRESLEIALEAISSRDSSGDGVDTFKRFVRGEDVSFSPVRCPHSVPDD